MQQDLLEWLNRHAACRPVAAIPPLIACLLAEAHLLAQRHTARALWHLAAAEKPRRRLLECGGLGALLHLARPEARSPEARRDARQALRRLADEAQVLSRHLSLGDLHTAVQQRVLRKFRTDAQDVVECSNQDACLL